MVRLRFEFIHKTRRTEDGCRTSQMLTVREQPPFAVRLLAETNNGGPAQNAS
jgi:hypothetical protein